MMKKIGLLIVTILLSVLLITVLTSTNKKAEMGSSYSREGLYNFLTDDENRRQAYAASIKLNQGTSANSCVYFISDVLRKNGVDVPKDVCNTSQIISFLKSEGWEKNRDYKELKPGDICFTTDGLGNKNGTPTHTYVFMKWVNENSYDYAYICDNQAKDYKGNIYHTRNVAIKAMANGYYKDSFSFFMTNDK